MASKMVNVLLIFQSFLILIINQPSSASPNQRNRRNINLSSLPGVMSSISGPVALMGAVKMASDATKLLPVSEDVLVKTVNDFAPIQLPQSPEVQEDAIRLDDRQLRLPISKDREERLVKMTGLASKNVDWKLYRLPLTLYQLKQILLKRKGSSSRLTLMSMESYLPKIMSNIDRFSEGPYRLLEDKIESDMDLDEFIDICEQLNQLSEGLMILPIGLKSGALQKPIGSMVLIGLGKFPTDRKQVEPPTIVPTILIGQVRQSSHYLSELNVVEESSISINSNETNVQSPSTSSPEPTPSTTALDVNESPTPNPLTSVATPVASNNEVSSVSTETMASSSSSATSSVQSQAQASAMAQAQSQSQPIFFPQQQPPPVMHPSQQRPIQRPPQLSSSRPNLPVRPPFDGRPSQQANLRPPPRPAQG